MPRKKAKMSKKSTRKKKSGTKSFETTEKAWNKRILRAAEDGLLERVRALLKGRRHLAKARDGSGQTALHFAASSGNPDLVRFLIERGAKDDVRTEGGVHGETPLHLAGSSDMLPKVRSAILPEHAT